MILSFFSRLQYIISRWKVWCDSASSGSITTSRFTRHGSAVNVKWSGTCRNVYTTHLNGAVFARKVTSHDFHWCCADALHHWRVFIRKGHGPYCGGATMTTTDNSLYHHPRAYNIRKSIHYEAFPSLFSWCFIDASLLESHWSPFWTCGFLRSCDYHLLSCFLLLCAATYSSRWNVACRYEKLPTNQGTFRKHFRKRYKKKANIRK